MSIFLKVLNRSEQFCKICEKLKNDKYKINIAGTADTQKAHLAASILYNTGKRACIISYSDAAAKKLCEEISVFMSDVTFLPPGNFMPYCIESMSGEIKADRMRALCEIITGNTAVMGPGAFLAFVMEKNKLKNRKFSIKTDDEIIDLPNKLAELGYKRVSLVEEPGQFSVRGGITDVFSLSADAPVRIELFGDTVDTIRQFDISTQLSEKNLDCCEISPADSDTGCGNIVDFFDDDTVFIFDEPAKVSEGMTSYENNITERIAELMLRGSINKEEKFFVNYDLLIKKIQNKNIVGLSAISHASPDYKPDETITVTAQTLPSYAGKMAMLMEDAQNFIKKKYEIYVFAGDKAHADGIKRAFYENGNSCKSATDDEAPVPGVITIYENSLKKGFVYPHINTVFISGNDIFVHRDKRRRIKPDDAKKISSFDELRPGEFVVHSSHGIGRFDELVTIESQGVSKEYLKILYKNSDCLYVPVNQLNLIYKYSHAGSDAPAPKLNRLGGSDWKNTKSGVKQSVKKLAIHLIELYAQRSRMQGHAFAKDTPWQSEFESEFIYEETPDQITCINDMKRDMESDKPMDRLLCGDVGYGKTEVAIRGAFKCAMDGFQCAYLVPTTILAAQHYNHFKERMKNFPVNVEMLSRFRTESEQNAIIKKLKSGETDIIIGTHKLLSDRVKFKNLGLLIVDEEQRFGVGHKEKIKDLKRGIDVLTLTATPIPRTLNMAMTGIRDMSIISQPPKDRHPIQTYVLQYDELLVKDAIEREVARGGQVYYVYNRVSGIYKTANHLKEILGGDIRIGVAHGRMNEDELESVMLKMLSGEIDVLVCTTIIETGIDIQNVNTMIVENAENMGLSQLYQLRGRVGRSDKMAYAYLTFRRDKSLSEVAEKRLLAIKEFTELGSGFKIALRDLEIRGAGNLLGAEQHGFMASVGYDMYIKLLNETVNELSGNNKKTEEALIDLNVEARIPDSYIEDSVLRLEAYRAIADIDSEDEAVAVIDKMVDRYGDVPKCVSILADIALLRATAEKNGITEITQKGDNILIYMLQMPDMKKLAEIMNEYKGKILFGAGEKPYLSLRKGFASSDSLPVEIKKLIRKISSNAEE